jgi:hypothetical protein
LQPFANDRIIPIDLKGFAKPRTSLRFPSFVCGTLGLRLGWHYGFAAAGAGMVAGLCLYLLGQHTLSPDLLMRAAGLPREREPLTRDERRRVWALVMQVLTKLDGTYGTFSHCRTKSRADSASEKEISDIWAAFSGLIDRLTLRGTITFFHGRYNNY